METCTRGFSFMPESNIKMDLKYVESEALERTWKTARRERLKQQEQKIWEEFVQEKDIVENIRQEDPYQFLNQLQEKCIKELLEIELLKMKQEKAEEVHILEQPIEPSSLAVEVDNQHTVTFSELVDKEECNMFQIFDDDRDEDVSGPEEEALNDSAGSPPCTVREAQAEDRAQSPKHQSPDKISSGSSTDVTNVIESSIYCAKIKDIRMKINEELLGIIAFLEQQNIINIDPSDIPRMMKRSVEFSGRFSRVHMYQLQRQVSDVERHSARAPPLAARTHFQAQLARAASLHHGLLHALQVFQKSLPQTACIKDSAVLLHTLVRLVGEGTRACGEARPATLAAATDLYNDSIQVTCEKLAETVNEYSSKMSEYLNSSENTSVSCSRKSSRQKGRKSSIGTWSKSGSKSITNTDARLSMYSLDTLRAGLNVKSNSSKDNQSSSGTSKMRGSVCGRRKPGKEDQPKSPKKSPRSRRPLMRAGGPQSVRARRAPREQDVRTMVENVAPCTSSHISREASPYRSPISKSVTPRQRSKEATPRTNRSREQARTPRNNTPRDKANSTPKETPVSPMKRLISPNLSKTSPLKTIESPKTSLKIDSPKVKTPVKSIQSPRLKEAVNKHEAENYKLKGKEKSPETKKAEEDLVYAKNEEPKTSERERNMAPDLEPTSSEVTRLVRQLCGGDSSGNRGERVTGAKNAQLLCVTGGSPRQPSTPQLLRILEETIQKKAPKSLFPKQKISARDAEKYRMAFNVSDQVTENLFQYRTKFVQHMLTSSMYANSAVGKPWERIGSVSDQIIDELLLNCAKEMELQNLINIIYETETS